MKTLKDLQTQIIKQEKVVVKLKDYGDLKDSLKALLQQQEYFMANEILNCLKSSLEIVSEYQDSFNSFNK